MFRVRVNFRSIRSLNYAAKIHDRDPVADMSHNMKIVGDKEVGQIHFALEFEEKVEDLRLNRDIQCGYGLIGDHKFWSNGQCSITIRWRWPPENS